MAKTSGKKGSTKKSGAASSASAGRSTKYNDIFESQAESLALLGWTMEQIAEHFGVSERTLRSWRSRHKSFGDTIKRSAALADGEVARSLHQRAIGYAHDDLHICSVAGQVVITPVRKYYPPDTSACIFWLKNRQPKLWKDKVESEVSGKDGGPVSVNITWGGMPDRQIDENGHAESGGLPDIGGDDGD